MKEHALLSNRFDVVGQLAARYSEADAKEKQKILVETVQHLPEEERDLFITVGILRSLLDL